MQDYSTVTEVCALVYVVVVVKYLLGILKNVVF